LYVGTAAQRVARPFRSASSSGGYRLEQVDAIMRTDDTWIRCPPIDELLDEPLPVVELLPDALLPVVDEPGELLIEELGASEPMISTSCPLCWASSDS
jgi:hypothetical protein